MTTFPKKKFIKILFFYVVLSRSHSISLSLPTPIQFKINICGTEIDEIVRDNTRLTLLLAMENKDNLHCIILITTRHQRRQLKWSEELPLCLRVFNNGDAAHKQIGICWCSSTRWRPKNYVKVKPFVLWIKHTNVISCLSIDKERETQRK